MKSVFEQYDTITSEDLSDDECFRRQILIEMSLVSRSSTYLLHKVIKATIALIGLVSGLPYLPIAMAYAGSNSYLSYLYGYSILLSSGILYFWAVIDISQTLANANTKWSYGELIAALLISTSSALPLATVSYSYGEALPIVILTLVAVSISNAFPINSIIKTLRFHFKYRNQPEIYEKQLFILDIIDKAIHVISSKDMSTILPLITSGGFLKLMSAQSVDQLSIENFCYSLKRLAGSDDVFKKRDRLYRLTILFSIVLSSGWMPTSYKLVSHMIESFVINKTASGIISVFVIMPDYLLECFLSQQLFEGIILILNKACKNDYQKGLVEKYYPKTLIFLLILGLFTTSTSFAAKANIVADNQSGLYKNFAEYWVITEVVFFKTSAMINLIFYTTKLYASYYAIEPIAAIAKTIMHLDAIKIYIRETEPEKLEQLYYFFHTLRKILLRYD